MRIVSATGLLLLLPAALPAQTLSVGASHWFSSPHVTEYRLGLGGFRLGPARLIYSAQYLKQGDSSKAHWYGGGAEVVLRIRPTAQPYVIGGMAAGAGRGPSGGGEEPGIGAWAGVGAELVTLGPIGLQAEALYNWRSGVQLHGFSLGLRIGSRFGTAAPPSVPLPESSIPRANPDDEEAIRLATAARRSNAPAAEIVATALSVMGRPYQWGGSDTTGFDCSGLIRYAYAQHGITLPRMSVDQARTGSEVGRALDRLAPGDILTFAGQPGGPVAHVGLYLGEGRFIHSATGGVQISELSESDPVGKWWHARWVGARRVL
jgi:cell wall-associated NlpC family hydrolase